MAFKRAEKYEKKEDGYWFTTENGKHVHVEDGQTPKEAVEERFGGNAKSNKNNKKVLSNEWLDDFYEQANGDEDVMTDLIRKNPEYMNFSSDPDDAFSMGDLDGIIDSYMYEKTGKNMLERYNDKFKQKWNENEIGKKEQETQYEDINGASAKFQKETNDKAVEAKNKLKSLNRSIPKNIDEAESMWQSVFEEYNKEPKKSNEVWDTKYQPIYDLYESIYDDFATKDYVEKMKKKGIKKPE